MADLPQEVVTDILCRLPVQPLLCFRSVSKSWRSLIDSPRFVDLHLRNSIRTSSNLSLILRKESEFFCINFDSFEAAVELAHPLMCYSNRIHVLGSCDGLLCISNVAEDIAFWNPSTKKHKVLPYLPLDRKSDNAMSMCNARVYGFGYDSVNEDYKLLRISQFIDLDGGGFAPESEVKVYSLRANEWKKVEDMPYVLPPTRKNGTLVSEALHWVVTRRFKFEETEAELIIGFDLTVGIFREVPLPDFTNDKFHMEVGVLGGCVCMIANYYDVSVDVWVMKDYGVKESWTKLCNVGEMGVFGSTKYVRPLGYSKSGGEVLLEQDREKLLWYNLERKRVQKVNVRGMPQFFDAEFCMGSLVPVEAIRRRKNWDLGKKNCRKKRDDFLSHGFKLVL